MLNAVLLGGFITFLLCVLDCQTHELSVVNAGHMPPLCRRAKTGLVESLGGDEANLPLGVGADTVFEQFNTKLEAGDSFFLYTDGLSEAANSNMDLFGTERISQLLAEPNDTETRLQRIRDELHKFSSGAPQKDDICMVAVSRR